jgi:hypothetical protein
MVPDGCRRNSSAGPTGPRTRLGMVRYVPFSSVTRDVSDRAAWRPEWRNYTSRDKGDLEPGVLARSETEVGAACSFRLPPGTAEAHASLSSSSMRYFENEDGDEDDAASLRYLPFRSRRRQSSRQSSRQRLLGLPRRQGRNCTLNPPRAKTGGYAGALRVSSSARPVRGADSGGI